MPVVLFGDQAIDLRGSLQRLHQSKKATVLVDSFLEKASIALREEVGAQPRGVRDQIPSFTSIFDLVERYSSSNVPLPALENALLCVYHLANFIGTHEQRPDQYLNNDDSCILGLGAGLLSAAAVACSRTLVDLPLIAVSVVRIAFRTGVVVGSISGQIHQPAEEQSTWSMIVSNVSEVEVQRELDAFHDRLNIPHPGRAYIALVSDRACTVSGRPSGLRQLVRDSKFFHEAKTQHIPVYGLYNAIHVYGERDVEKITDIETNSVQTVLRPCRPLLSTCSGAELIYSSAYKLFQAAVNEILTQTIRWNLILQGTVSLVQRMQQFDSRVLTFGATDAAKSLISALQAGIDKNITLDDLTGWCTNLSQFQPTGRLAHSNIAIVGMSGRFPGATSVEGLWQVLEQGLDVHKKIPKDRFDVETYFDPSGQKVNTSHTPYGCFIEEPGLFDPRFFNMSPREAAQTDPMHRLAITTAYEALEMSGFVPDRTPSTHLDRVGTFYGQTSDDWREVNAAQTVETYFIPGGVRAFAPGRINYYFDFRGPSYSVDTACSSSLAAIQIACTSLWSGECDTALAGGLNVLTAPDIFAGLSRGQFLSKTGSCKTWDSKADGYCRADGVGSIVMKRLEDAEADKDNILGVILGAATNHSADAVSITHPHAGNQSYLYENVLHSAGVNPTDVSYIEMHGTGTQAGDLTEMRSVTAVFAPEDGTRLHSNQPLYIGAIKSNVGHSEAAAGVTALIKVLLMLRKNAIPPHVGIKGSLNPAFPDLERLNVRIPYEKTDWLSVDGKPRLAFLNNFSAAGGNTALLLQDPPQLTCSPKEDPRSAHTVVVSAKSISSLQNNMRQLMLYIKQHPSVSLPCLAYTTTARRIHHNYRVAVSVSEVREIPDAFALRLQEKFTPIPSKVPNVVFVFTGQGAFYPLLGRQLFRQSSQFHTDITYLDSLTISQGYPSILPAIEGGGEEVLNLSPLVVQLALVCVQIALAKLWLSWGISPSAVIGHSLGEYAALNVAGILSVNDTIHLVGERARVLQETCSPGTHAMLAVKSPLSAIQSATNGKPIQVACLNSRSDTTIGGTNEEIDEITQALGHTRQRSVKLDLPYAFHSAQVDPALDPFELAVGGTIFETPTIPLISTLLATVVREGGNIDANYLRRHAREPVNFLGAIQAAQDDGILNGKTVYVEIGPHPICTNMMSSTLENDNVMVPSLRKSEDPWRTLSTSLCLIHCSGQKVDWGEVHRDYEASHELLDLPTYSFDSKKYWIDYVNDWCLTKIEPRTTSQSENPKADLSESKLSTSTVHRVVEEDFEEASGRMIIQSDISDPVFRTAILGHLVNGAGLCPSSIYADIALTLGAYIYERIRPSGDRIGMNVAQMEVTKALVAKKGSSEPQLLQVSITADLVVGRARLRYASISPQGREIAEHATASINYEQVESWLNDWASNAYLVEARIETLRNAVARGEAHQISRGLVYKLFSALVQYDHKYQGIEEVTLDSGRFEATSSVKFQASEKDGRFYCSPYWIDSLAHLSGFILNGSDAVDSKNFVYVSHGWKSMRFSKPFSVSSKYNAYVRMQPAGKDVMSGDVYVFESGTIIGVVGGLKFQRIPRAVLNTLLPPETTLSKKGPLMDLSTPVKKSQQTAKPREKATNKLESQKLAKLTESLERSQQSSSITERSERRLPDTVTARVLSVISCEAEIEPSELQDECAFTDIGVDSLLSLQITGKIRENIDIEVPSSIFMEYPTVGELKKFLARFDSIRKPTTFSSTSSSSSASEDHLSSNSPMPSASSSPLETPSERDSPASGQELDTTMLIRTTIAENMGVPIEEVSGSNDLLSLGMDSLMSITILGVLREQSDLVLPPSLFQDHPSIDDIEAFLGLKRESIPRSRVKAEIQQSNAPHGCGNFPPAVSILMQGNAKTATKKLFLFPDGSGSATSYANIPSISSDVCVYGLNCPFMTTPQDFTIGIEGVAELYLAEVRRRQPHGPYYLGGWSAGGVIAYEVMQQITWDGDRVERLIFFDSPCPLKLEPLPSRLHHFFRDIGLLGGDNPNGAPHWLLPHFESSIKALTAYKPKPVRNVAEVPKTLIIWARYGVCRYPSDPRPTPSKDDPPSMKWLLENRRDFGFNGWDKLLGAQNITTTDKETSIDGNHFTMMKEPLIQRMAVLIEEGLR